MPSMPLRVRSRLAVFTSIAAVILGITAVGNPITVLASGACGTNGVAGGSTCTYTTTGTDSYTVPTGVTEVTFDVFGGHGGGGSSTGAGGAGGESKVTLSVSAGEVLQLTVGAAGVANAGGGDTGGGASDVRSGSCTSTLTCALADRVIVAGGGGGGGDCSNISDVYGGCAAGSGGAGAGGNGSGGGAAVYCNGGGGGGTSSAGGAGGSSGGNLYPGAAGTLGSGGQGGGWGGNSGNSFPGGAGGDGYYGGGGGGGGTYTSSCDAGGGGGGSGYVTPSALAATLATGVRSGAGEITATALSGTATSTALVSSANPTSVPATITYTATVSPVPDGGSVQFADGGTTIGGCGTQAVNTTTGVATCTVSYHSAAAHAITADYLGDASYLVSGASLTETLNAAGSTSTTLTASPNPATVRQSITYTATVSPAPDGGTVGFTSNGGAISGCSTQGVNTTTGVATCTTSYAVSGNPAIVATYGGDTSYPTSTSNTVTETVNAASSTTTTLTSSKNPATAGDTVTFTATVSPAPDTGTVEFDQDGSAISSCTAQALNSSGVATCSYTYSTSGSHTLNAIWAGDTSYPTSTSNTLTETVNPRTDTVTLTTSKTPTSPGEQVTYTATVNPNPGGGTMDFTDSSSAISGCTGVTVNTSTGVATCTVVYTATGSHSIQAAYSGDTLYPSNSSTTVVQTVSATNPTYTSPGTYLYTVPSGVTQVTFTTYGGQGGPGSSSGGGGGGNGGEAGGTFTVTAGETFEVSVGAAGSLAGSGGGSGGGASDIRSGTCAATLSCGLSARIVVAGGGGGGGGCSSYSYPNCTSGAGGAGSGGNGNGGGAAVYCNGGGGGGTSSAGGAGGSSGGNLYPGAAGTLGSGGLGGGWGGNSGQSFPGGSGGNGYYGGGGGGGGTYTSSCDAGGGGGGSGYIDPTATSSSTGTGVQSGNGKVVIVEYTPTTTTLTASPSPATYGQMVTWTATVSPAESGSVQFSINGSAYGGPVTVSGGVAQGTLSVQYPAGTYSFSAAFTPSGFAVASSGSTSETINKATLTVTPTAQSKTYGQADPAFTYAITGYQNGDTSSSLTSLPTCGVSATHTNAGGYTIACSGGSAANYVFDDGATATLTVNQATLTVTPANQSITYGQADPAYTYTMTGYQYSDTSSSLTTLPSCGVAGPHSNAGTYTITCSGGSAANYVFDETATATLTVGTATLTVTPANQVTTYGQGDPAFTYTITGYQNGDTSSSLTSLPTCGVSGAHTNAGTYTITCSGGSASNYVFDDSATATLTVNKATLAVTPANQAVTYGQADPTFTYTITGYQYSDTVSSLTSLPSCGVSGTHTNAGTYTIACSGGTASNYVFDDTATATLTVNKATLTVTPANQAVAYGQADPAFTYAITGYQYSDTASSLTSLPSCTVSGSHTAAGTYTITCSGGSAANYVFDETATATLTVNKATLTVTPANQTTTYGQTPSFGYAITGYQYSDTAASLTSLPSCTVSGAHTDVGTYTITCSGGSAANYVFDESATATLTVNRATLTVTPANQAVTYGQADPTFTYAITGYQYSDTAASLTSLPSCTVSGAHVDAGSYTIACSGGSASNYVFDDTATATLTVNKATLTLTPNSQTITDLQGTPAFTYSITGYQYSDGVSALSTRPACGVSGPHAAVGTYTITCSGGSAANYVFDDSATATYQVLPLRLVTMDGYGGLHVVEAGTVNVSGAADWPGWNIARGVAVVPGGNGGYTLDGFGGVHPFGEAPGVSTTAYWPNWDIARSIVVDPCDATGHSGYVLDGFGGVHPFGGAPAVTTTAYWPGWDIAVAMTVNPCSGGTVSGYVLDGYGGVHSFSSGAAIADPSTTAYWPGWNIARSIAVSASGEGYVLDGYGGVHPFGGAKAVTTTAYWPGSDVARGIVVLAGGGGGYVLDGYGGLHPFADAGAVTAPAYWPGWLIARGLGLG